MHFIAENMKMPTETNRNLLEYKFITTSFYYQYRTK